MKDGRRGKSRIDAAIAPVHAPVRGRGTATKSISAVSARFRSEEEEADSRVFARAMDREKSHVKKRFIAALRDAKKSARGRRKMRISGTGIMLPRTARLKPLRGAMPIQCATGTAPRSSTTGAAARRSSVASSGRPDERRLVAIDTPIPLARGWQTALRPREGATRVETRL